MMMNDDDDYDDDADGDNDGDGDGGNFDSREWGPNCSFPMLSMFHKALIWILALLRCTMRPTVHLAAIAREQCELEPF